RPPAPLRPRALRERAPVVRARAEGGGSRLPGRRRRGRAVEPRSRPRARPRHHALRLRPRRHRERLHRGVADRGLTGVLLVGGASTRFGSPKALAPFEGETLADRAWRLLGEACDERIAVGKREQDLPFPVLDDGTPVRAPLAGAAAGGDVAHPPSGPLPGAYRRSALGALERSLARGELALRAAITPLDVRIVVVDERLLANVNEPGDLERLRGASTTDPVE